MCVQIFQNIFTDFYLRIFIYGLGLMLLLDSVISSEGVLVPPDTAVTKKKMSLKRYDYIFLLLFYLYLFVSFTYHLFIYLFIYLFINLFIYLFICIFTYLYYYLFAQKIKHNLTKQNITKYNITHQNYQINVTYTD